MQQCLNGTGVTSITRPYDGGAYPREEDEQAVRSLMRSTLPQTTILIAFKPFDTEGRLLRNTRRLREFVPLGLDDDPDWPRQVRAFYVTEEGDSLIWKEVMPYPTPPEGQTEVA
jgi:hypothetical protein